MMLVRLGGFGLSYIYVSWEVSVPQPSPGQAGSGRLPDVLWWVEENRQRQRGFNSQRSTAGYELSARVRSGAQRNRDGPKPVPEKGLSPQRLELECYCELQDAL